MPIDIPSINIKRTMIALACGIPVMSFAQSLDNTFDLALGTASLSRQNARFDPEVLPFFQSPFGQNLLHRQLMQNPLRTPYILGMHRDQLASPSDRPTDELSAMSRMLGVNVRRSLLGNPIENQERQAIRPSGLQNTLQRMQREGLLKTIPANLNVAPEPARQAAALVLSVLMDTIPLRRAAFQNVPNLENFLVRSRWGSLDSASPETTGRQLRDLEAFDMGFMSAAGQDIAAACTVARNKMLGIADSEKYQLRIDTAWGTVVLSGGTDNTYEGTDFLLIIDSGGNDTYIGIPTARTATNWASIVLDAKGDDKYVSETALLKTSVRQSPNRATAAGSGPASAIGGFAFIMDMGGNDLYRSRVPGLASAVAGVSVIVDSVGNDEYDAYTYSQGYASYGLALLEDLGGKDTYNLFSNGQGNGGPMGFGALIDRTGDDTYTANNTEIDFPSSQDPKANTSMAQGAGTGRRADFSDGHSQSGGIGVLYDLDGADKYSCGVFGQGVGYWDGTGILWDRSGNDQYTGVWYAQGSAAHTSIGILEDESGNDRYRVTTNMSHGAGHDFSAGFLLDRFGNDTYLGSNLSLGASSTNGFGVFMDFMGDDTYEGSNITLGRAAEVPQGSLRARALGLGMFYDGSGTDRYPTATNWARDAVRQVNWTDRANEPEQSQFGIFWDR
jgi:hypothetical protein